jgi:hypothetical protein
VTAAVDEGRVRLPLALARAGAGLALLAILGATLTPAGPSALLNGGFLCFRCGSASAANLVRNVILFLPLGFFLYGLLPRAGLITLVGATLSGSVELLQVFIPGRNSMLVDLLANTAGAGLGALLAASLPLWLRPAEATRRRLFAGFTLAAAVTAAAPAFLLTPAPPQDTLWAVWNHPLQRSGAYPGAILDARLGALPLPPGGVPTDAPDRFLAGDTLTIRLLAAEPAPEARGLFRVWSGPTGREVITMTVHGTDVVASVHYRANLLGLSQPRARAPGILGGVAPGDTIALALMLQADGRIHVQGPGGLWTGAGADPSMGWSLLYFPPRIGPVGTTLLAFLWCASLLFASAFFAPGPRSATTAGAGLLILLAGLPWAVPLLAPLPVGGWAGAMVGWVAGVALRTLLR